MVCARARRGRVESAADRANRFAARNCDVRRRRRCVRGDQMAAVAVDCCTRAYRRRTAQPRVSTIVSSTGCSSVGERLMTSSTSLVAVWYSSDSLQLARPRLHLVEQPHVLDRDDGLVGEGRDELDLLVGERLHLVRGRADDADRDRPPRSSGTPSCVRSRRPPLASRRVGNRGRRARLRDVMTCFSSAASPVQVPRRRRSGFRRSLEEAGVAPCRAAMW